MIFTQVRALWGIIGVLLSAVGCSTMKTSGEAEYCYQDSATRLILYDKIADRRITLKQNEIFRFERSGDRMTIIFNDNEIETYKITGSCTDQALFEGRK